MVMENNKLSGIVQKYDSTARGRLRESENAYRRIFTNEA